MRKQKFGLAMQMFLILILLVLCTTNHTRAENKTRQEILAQLLYNYDRDVYPNDGEGNQTNVKVQMTIIDIDQVNDQREEIQMIVFLRMAWYDPRLQFKNETNITFSFIELTGKTVDRVWMPDLYFSDERDASSHGIMGQEKVIYIYQDGYIYFSERITMAVECIMNIGRFPFDTQECILHLESYAYTTRSMLLEWAPNPVQSLDKHTPYFKLEDNIKNTSGIASKSNSLYREQRNFSYLNATLTFKRDSNVYGFVYFGTYPFYAVMALTSFGLKETNPRVTACFTAAGGVVVQWIVVYSKLPAIPHFTVIDLWILLNMIFILLVILYHVIINIWTNTEQDRKKRFEENKTTVKKDEAEAPAMPGNENSSNHIVSHKYGKTEWAVFFKRILPTDQTDRNTSLNSGMYTIEIADDSGKPGTSVDRFNRTFEDFFYLHTYLQAKYPDIKWPSLPMQNVLTSADKKKLQNRLEEYKKEIVKLLQPKFWDLHADIKKIIIRFTKENTWIGACFCSWERLYIFNLLDSAGQTTGPNIVVFICFLFLYCIFVFSVFFDTFENSRCLACLFVAPVVSAIIIVPCKIRIMKPPKLWHDC